MDENKTIQDRHVETAEKFRELEKALGRPPRVVELAAALGLSRWYTYMLLKELREAGEVLIPGRAPMGRPKGRKARKRAPTREVPTPPKPSPRAVNSDAARAVLKLLVKMDEESRKACLKVAHDLFD